MTPEAFVVWLKGYIEIANPTYIGDKEITIIKQKLGEVPMLPPLMEVPKESESPFDLTSRQTDPLIRRVIPEKSVESSTSKEW